MLDTKVHVSLSNLLKNFPAKKYSSSGMRLGSVMISIFFWSTRRRSTLGLLIIVLAIREIQDDRDKWQSGIY